MRGGGGGGWRILHAQILNGYNVFKTYENGIKIRDFVISEIYLPIIWYGELGFTEFNITMVTFLEGMF